MPKIEVLTGQYAQQQYRIEVDSVWIGSDAQCELCLREPGISRHHARILRGEDDRFWIEDAGGSFGTVLNGRHVERASLHTGDELTLGRVKLRFCDEQPHSSGSLPDILAFDDGEGPEEQGDFQSTVIARAEDVLGLLPGSEDILGLLPDAEAEPTRVGVSRSPKDWEEATPHEPVSTEHLEAAALDEAAALELQREPLEELEPLSEADMLLELTAEDDDDEWIELVDEDSIDLIEDDEDALEEVEEELLVSDEDVLEALDVEEEPVFTAMEDNTAPGGVRPKGLSAIALAPRVSHRPPKGPPNPRLHRRRPASPLDEVLGRHTLTGIRKEEVIHKARKLTPQPHELSAPPAKPESRSKTLEDGVREFTSATRSRTAILHGEMERLREQLDVREQQISSLHQELEAQKTTKEQAELLKTTLALYREDNQRLQYQIATYEEAAVENDALLKKLELFQQEIVDLSAENQKLKKRVLQYRKQLVQHGLLRKRSFEKES